MSSELRGLFEPGASLSGIFQFGKRERRAALPRDVMTQDPHDSRKVKTVRKRSDKAGRQSAASSSKRRDVTVKITELRTLIMATGTYKYPGVTSAVNAGQLKPVLDALEDFGGQIPTQIIKVVAGDRSMMEDWSPLHELACQPVTPSKRRWQFALADHLIASGMADLQSSYMNCTALLLAAVYESEQMVVKLLPKSDRSAVSSAGFGVLHLAVYNQLSTDTIRQICSFDHLAVGATAGTNGTRMNPIHLLAEQDTTDSFSVVDAFPLIAAVCSPTETTNKEETFLHLCAYHGNEAGFDAFIAWANENLTAEELFEFAGKQERVSGKTYNRTKSHPPFSTLLCHFLIHFLILYCSPHQRFAKRIADYFYYSQLPPPYASFIPIPL